MNQCQGTTTEGIQCLRNIESDLKYCWQHSKVENKFAKFNRFTRLKKLGKGNSQTYLIKYLDQYAVLKEFNVDHASNWEAEVDILSRVSKYPDCFPSIICIYNSGIEEVDIEDSDAEYSDTEDAEKLIETGKFIIIEEYAEGITLLEYIKLNQLEYYELIDIMRQIINTIFYLHSNDVVHRDIKMANIIISANQNKKIKLLTLICPVMVIARQKELELRIICLPKC